MKKYNVLIPAIDELNRLGSKLIELRKNKPEIFRENLNQIKYYGRFPYCIWSQEPSERNFVYINYIEQTLKFAQDNNISIYYEFSNTQLTKETVYDSYCNMVLSLTKDIDTYAIVYSPYLIKHIKEKFPKIKLIRPEIYDKTTTENDYEAYIINYKNYSENEEKIFENPHKYLLFLNSYGLPKKEYLDRKCKDIVEFNTVNYNNYPYETDNFENSKKLADFIPIDLMEQIADKGIENFIIRNYNNNFYEMLESCVYYLIKPEYQNEIRLDVLKSER